MIDISIIEDSIKGNLHSFKILVDNSSSFAFSVAFRMLGNEEEAEDIVQESMITVWRSLNKLRTPEGFKSWLYRIVINKCYDQLRKRKRSPEFIADEKTWNYLHNQ